MQYLICCLCLSIGRPFRQAFYTNPFYLVSVIVMMVYQIYVILHQGANDVMALVSLPEHYRYWILGMAAANSACSYLFEKFAISQFTRYWHKRKDDQRVQTVNQ